jgi:DNA-binding MurR/RpiR family transcriptional regulator
MSEDVVGRIRAALPTLPALVREVAQVVLDDPAGCARLSIAEMADRVGTSEATVARTARLLGYGGYRQLRLAMAAYPGAEPPPVEMLGGVGPGDDLPTVVAKLTSDERRSLADTARALDLTALDAAVTALVAARRVDTYGVMSSGLVAADLAQKLLRLGLAAQPYADPHLAVTSALRLRPGDVAVGVSYSGTTEEVREPLTLARAAGATTVLVTGNPRGPLAAVADHVLLAAAGRETDLRPAELASRISQLLVVDCLFVGVAQRMPGSTEALHESLSTLAPKHHRAGRGH